MATVNNTRQSRAAASNMMKAMGPVANDVSHAPRGAGVTGPKLQVGDGALGNTINTANLVGFGGFVGSLVIGGGLKGVAWVSNKIGELTGSQGPKNAAGSIKRFLTRASETTVGDVLGAPFTGVEKLGQATGVKAIETAGAVPKRLAFKAAEGISTTVGNSVHAIVESKYTGLSGPKARHVARLSSDMQKANDDAIAHLNKVTASLEGKGKTLEESEELGKLLATARKAPHELEAEERTKLTAALREHAGVEASETGMFATAKTIFKKFKTAVGLEKPSEAEAAITGFEKTSARASGLAGKVAFRTNFAESIASIPSSIATMRLPKALDHSIYYGGQAVTAYSSLKALRDPIRTMKNAYEGETGQKASTSQILFSSNVPDSVKAMRKEFYMHAPAHVLLNMGAMVLWAKTRGPASGFLMNAMAGISGLTDMLFGKLEENSKTTVYAKIQQAYQASNGEPLPKGAIVGLILNAAPELKLTPDNKQLLAVAEQYVAQNATPAQVLADLENHGRGLREKMAAVNAEMAQEAGAPTTAWRAKVSQPQAAATPKAVIGDWTARAANDSNPAIAGQSRA